MVFLVAAFDLVNGMELLEQISTKYRNVYIEFVHLSNPEKIHIQCNFVNCRLGAVFSQYQKICQDPRERSKINVEESY